MNSFEDFFKHLFFGNLLDTPIIRHEINDNIIVNRPIEEFKGAILNLCGTEYELESYKKNYSEKIEIIGLPIEDQIYTVNINADSKPDMVADISSFKGMSILPDKRFDIIYLSNIPSAHVILKNVFENANRLLTENGILLFRGGVRTNELNTNNPMIQVNEKWIIDTTGILTMAGFAQGKLFKSFNKPSQGQLFIASKLTENIKLEEFYKTYPIAEVIVSHIMKMDAQQVANEMPSRGNDRKF